MKMQGFTIMMKPPVAEVTDNIGKFFSRKTKIYLNIFDYFLNLHSKYKDEYVFPSQTNVARTFGVSRKTINHYIKDMVSKGILKKIPQGIKKPCLYKLNPYFFCEDIKSKLRVFFKTLRVLPLFLLTPFASGSSTINTSKVTQLSQGILGSNIIINNSNQMNMIKNKLAVIKKLKSLRNVKPQELVKLFAFTVEVLLYADDKVLSTKSVRDPYALFMTIAQDYSLWCDLYVDWQAVKQVESRYPNLNDLFDEPKTYYNPTRSPLRPSVVKNKSENQPQSTIKIKAYIPPLKIQIDTLEENKAREEARKSKEWQECERILGIKINPPIPEFVVKRS